MADTSEKTSEPDGNLQLRFPTAYTNLFLLIIWPLLVILTIPIMGTLAFGTWMGGAVRRLKHLVFIRRRVFCGK